MCVKRITGKLSNAIKVSNEDVSVQLEALDILSDLPDLHVAQLSLVLLTSAAKKQPQALIGTHKVILPEIMNLIKSPLLQGSALNCTLNLSQALVQANIPGLSYRELLEMLMVPVNNPQAPLHKQVGFLLSILKCTFEVYFLKKEFLKCIFKGGFLKCIFLRRKLKCIF
jgi:hypothetical protein